MTPNPNPDPDPNPSPNPDPNPSQAASAYAWDKRDPRHANAEGSGLWEAAALQQHYHPSVQQFVASVLNGSGIKCVTPT